MRRTLVVLALMAVLAGAFTVVALSQEGDGQPPATGAPYHEPPLPLQDGGPVSSESLPPVEPMTPACTSVTEDLGFRNFWAGESFDGLALTQVERRCSVPQPGELYRANSVSYIYGSCTSTEESCSYPIVIQSWPAQDRNRQMYFPAEQRFGMVAEDTTVSGLPATWFESGFRLEIWRPDVTVAIFGTDHDRIERFAQDLILGPSVLADLQDIAGVEFDPDCLYSKKFCWGGTDA